MTACKPFLTVCKGRLGIEQRVPVAILKELQGEGETNTRLAGWFWEIGSFAKLEKMDICLFFVNFFS